MVNVSLADAAEEPAAESAAVREVSAARRRRGWRLVAALVLALGAAVMVLPFGDLLLGALRTPAERLMRPPAYWPATPVWGNFTQVFERYPLSLWIFNSLVTTISITCLQVATSVTAGYALAKFRFRGRDLLLRFVLVAQLFPFFLFLIPLVFILRYWPLFGGNDWLGQGGTGLMGTYAALILPFSVSWYGVFLMRQFMIGVPDELLDAARMDGAGEARILWSIVLPIVRPAAATLALFVFVYHWNEVAWTLTVTQSAPSLQTAPIGIYMVRGAFDTEAQLSLQQAMILVTIAPVIAAFLFLQRFYVSAVNGPSRRMG
ncbi:carbohydrate ABC transporter permease [Aureimonas sp. ME7]|uniref:carbohydrate ABC transporter permease n=1 Tax=Aureimonas sp. ME7 TaxID=2744252 RepID=UPI0015F6D01A|nr:carbohydrate ABC transporter permease [Aureimonas sp. ME7]